MDKNFDLKILKSYKEQFDKFLNDDDFKHSWTKMADLAFTSHDVILELEQVINGCMDTLELAATNLERLKFVIKLQDVKTIISNARVVEGKQIEVYQKNKNNGSLKNQKRRLEAEKFLNQLLEEDPKATQYKLAHLLEAESRINTSQYESPLSLSTCQKYAKKAVKGATER